MWKKIRNSGGEEGLTFWNSEGMGGGRVDHFGNSEGKAGGGGGLKCSCHPW